MQLNNFIIQYTYRNINCLIISTQLITLNIQINPILHISGKESCESHLVSGVSQGTARVSWSSMAPEERSSVVKATEPTITSTSTNSLSLKLTPRCITLPEGKIVIHSCHIQVNITNSISQSKRHLCQLYKQYFFTNQPRARNVPLKINFSTQAKAIQGKAFSTEDLPWPYSPGSWCVVQLNLLHKGCGDGIPTAQQISCYGGDLRALTYQEVHLACVRDLQDVSPHYLT